VFVVAGTCVEGNVREFALAGLWGDPNRFAYNRRYTPDELRGACATCEHAHRCRGGCTSTAYAIHGRPGTSSHCFLLHDGARP
jgi:radical SAM protein with 4Fe4S-binding SPASM domain